LLAYLFDNDHVRDFEVRAGYHLDPSIGEDLVQLRVELFVASVALDVVDGLAQHRDRDDEA